MNSLCDSVGSTSGFWVLVALAVNSREVLVLYRKRELAMRRHEHGGVARFRYSDLKEAARFAADAVVMQIQMGEE